MKIKISSLSEGSHFYNLDASVEELDLPREFFGKVRVQVLLEKTKEHILIRTSLNVHRHCECDRCLRKYDREFYNEYHMFYIHDIRNKDLYDEDVVTVIRNDQDFINISNDVREYAMLAIPMKNLCKEDCLGLCPRCGKDLNVENCVCEKEEVDSRWLVLKEIFKQ